MLQGQRQALDDPMMIFMAWKLATLRNPSDVIAKTGGNSLFIQTLFNLKPDEHIASKLSDIRKRYRKG